MTKVSKRILSMLSASALVFSIAGAQLAGANFSVLNELGTSISLTAEAAVIGSGTFGSRFSAECGDAWLYFTVQSESLKRVSVTGCSSYKADSNVSIPDTVDWMGKTYKVTYIGSKAFEKQTNITGISGGNNLISIQSEAFTGCTNLKYVSIAKDRSGCAHLTSIGASAFRNCKKLQSMGAFIDTKYIGDYAFYGCQSLYDIRLEGTLSIGKSAFSQCRYVSEIDLSQAKLQTIPERAFTFCMDAKAIKLPETLVRIEREAFTYCQYFDKIYFPPTMRYVGESAFQYCVGLETVMTNENLATIEDLAFNCCNNMRYFVCKNPNAQIGSYAVGFCQNTKNEEFVVWGNGGTVQDYANENNVTYYNVQQAAQLAKERQKDYMWKTGNTNFAWAVDGDPSKGYYYSEAHKKYIPESFLDGIDDRWEGSCYGMAAVSVLTQNGDITVEQFTKNQFTKIPQIRSSNMSLFTKSFVNSCWATATSTTDYNVDDKMLMTDPEMLTYMEFITYGADAAILSKRNHYQAGSGGGGHAIVCFGMEFREDASDRNQSYWDRNGINANARILVCDGNIGKYDNYYCYYVNTETGAWSNGTGSMYTYYDASGKLVSTMLSDFSNGKMLYGGYWKLTHTTDKMFQDRNYRNGSRTLRSLLTAAS